MGASRPSLVLRALGVAIPAAVTGAVWMLAAAMFLTGAVLWRDWHALAREGVDHEARVEDCEWRSMHRQRLLTVSRGDGYYSCHYSYRLGPGPGYSGYFQSPRERKAGEPIAIRYRRERPSASATVTDLAHPSVAPGAFMALPLLYAGWQAREQLRRLWSAARGPRGG